MSDDEKSNKPPEQFGLMSWMANEVRDGIDRLKEGGKSGISDMFGKAADLLPSAVRAKATHPGEIVAYAEPSEDEIAGRSLYLACQARRHCSEFLESFSMSRRNAEPEQMLGELLASDNSSTAFEAALKELTSVTVFLLSLDLRSPNPLPKWLHNFLELGLGATDFLMPEPAVEAIMKNYGAVRKNQSTLCGSVAKSICSKLKCGSADGSVESTVSELLQGGGSFRRDILRKALEAPFGAVEVELRTVLSG